ncbi:hypothetical protein XENOCAPTIV_022218 [Xenoophorus captivus]|uniref:Far11/STRP N-terminal domain-containing protein n=1 Tax=Xenoophorus captivus TaxID=1517983 RepID=A0ABV0RTR8_9TELE
MNYGVSDKKWTDLDAAQHRAHAMRLLDGLEVIAREKRLKAARAILYMAQGQWNNSAACSSAVRKPAISLADSTDLRVLLNIMYLMVETIQQDDPADKPEWKIMKETFRAELGKNLQKSFSHFKVVLKMEA